MLAKQAGLKEKKTVEVENAYLIVFILPDDQEHETVEYSSHTHPEHTR